MTHPFTRVILIYQPENLAPAMTEIARTLGVTDFEGPFDPPGFGLTVAISFAAGLELIAPSGEAGFAGMAREFLAEHGEGFYGLVYGVDDLSAAEAQAAAAGHPRRGERLDCFSAQPAWRQRFASLDEAVLGSVAGVEMTLIQSRSRGG